MVNNKHKPDEIRKSRNIIIRVSKSEYLQYKQHSKDTNTSISELFRNLMDEDINRYNNKITYDVFKSNYEMITKSPEFMTEEMENSINQLFKNIAQVIKGTYTKLNGATIENQLYSISKKRGDILETIQLAFIKNNIDISIMDLIKFIHKYIKNTYNF